MRIAWLQRCMGAADEKDLVGAGLHGCCGDWQLITVSLGKSHWVWLGSWIPWFCLGGQGDRVTWVSGRGVAGFLCSVLVGRDTGPPLSGFLWSVLVEKETLGEVWVGIL